MSAQPYATWWDCGDEVCDCTQPKIQVQDAQNKFYPNLFAQIELEVGPFCSQASFAERNAQWDWMIEAARRHKVSNLADIEKDYALNIQAREEDIADQQEMCRRAEAEHELNAQNPP